VEITVAVEIDELNAAGAKSGVRRGIDRFRAKTAIAFVQEGHYGLVLLTDQGHKVGPAIAVKITHRDVNRPMPAIHHVPDKYRPGPVGSSAPQVKDPPFLAPAEARHDQVELAVAIEVGRLHVGDAPDSLQQRDGRKRAVRLAAQPDDTADLVIGGI